jgi:predicted amidohydrolase YtcJ
MSCLVKHPKIYIDSSRRRTDALFVEDGRITAIGADAKNASVADVIEPDAECLFPALTDAHIHLWGIGQRLGAVRFDETDTPDNIYRRLKNGEGQLESNEWIVGRGWDSNFWDDGKELSLEKLDELFPDRPICLHRSDHHAIFVNSEAIRRSGITAAWEPEGDGKLQRDSSGEFTGLIIDEAMRPIEDAIPPPTESEDEQIYRNLASELKSHGITSGHMAKMTPKRVEMLRRLHDEGALPLRISAWVHGPSLLESDLALEPSHDPEGWCSIETIKYFADGALGSLGALVIDPYRDGTYGLEMISKEQLLKEAKSFAEQGWQLAVHAIGDKAARNVVDVFEQLPDDDRRHRLEHAQMMTDEDIARMGDASIVASIQPIHLHSDCSWAHKVMDDKQLDRLYQFGLLNENCVLAGGSDYPIDDLNPWHGISVGMTRETDAGHDFFPDKGLPVEPLLESYTSGAAYAAHWEDTLGKLEPGYQADFIALDRDPFEVSAESIWETEVYQTWMGGEPQL